MSARGRVFTAIVIACCLVPAPRAVAADTAAEVAGLCDGFRGARHDPDGHVRGFEQTSDAGHCWGTFSAIQDVGAITLDSPNRTALWLCLPPEGTTLEFVKVFIRYMDEHPNRGHERFGLVVLDSLREAFPCPRPGYRFK
jgi:hypothetical protein